MTIPIRTLLCLYLLHFHVSTQAANPEAESVVYSSGEQRVRLLELYSSQGCSSCPPAQNWVNQLETSEHLWKKVIPVVFHVDYWDYLGWRDPFAKNRWSKRQRSHKWQGNIRSVYTPGFVVDGAEWRGWFQRQPLQTSDEKSGSLTVTLDKGYITAVYFNSDFMVSHPIKLNIVQLAMNEITPVGRGENRNKQLIESFIVLNQRLIDAEASQTKIPLFEFESELEIEDKTKALVFWITEDFSLRPIQATGGWLPTRN